MNFHLQPSPVFLKSPVVSVNKTWLCVLCPAPLSATAETQNGHQRCCEQHAEHRHEQILYQTPPPKKNKKTVCICRNLHTPHKIDLVGKLNKNLLLKQQI